MCAADAVVFVLALSVSLSSADTPSMIEEGKSPGPNSNSSNRVASSANPPEQHSLRNLQATEPLVRRSYDVLPTLGARMIDIEAPAPGSDSKNPIRRMESNDLQKTLAGFGVTWPNGSSVVHLPAIGKVAVVNTKDNLQRIEHVLRFLNVVPFQIRVEFFFVAFPTGMVGRTSSGKHFTSDDALELWKEGRGRPVSTLLAMASPTTDGHGQVAIGNWQELIFPTEFSLETPRQGTNPPPTAAGMAITPGGFVTCELDATVCIMPEVSPDGQTIDITLTPVFIEEPAWEDYEAVLFAAGSPPANLSCRQPIFSSHSLTTQLSVRRGSTVVVGGGWNLRRTPEVMYLIMKTDLIDPDGKVLPPPDLNSLLPHPF